MRRAQYDRVRFWPPQRQPPIQLRSRVPPPPPPRAKEQHSKCDGLKVYRVVNNMFPSLFFKIWINNIHYFFYSTLSSKLGPFCREYERAYRVIMLGPFCRPYDYHLSSNGPWEEHLSHHRIPGVLHGEVAVAVPEVWRGAIFKQEKHCSFLQCRVGFFILSILFDENIKSERCKCNDASYRILFTSPNYIEQLTDNIEVRIFLQSSIQYVLT